jgi:ActR/RegA family two-component response regulator
MMRRAPAFRKPATGGRSPPTFSGADALKMLKGFTPDFAVLDINLGAGTSLPVAQELSKRNIPFIFATGYGDLLDTA